MMMNATVNAQKISELVPVNPDLLDESHNPQLLLEYEAHSNGILIEMKKMYLVRTKINDLGMD